MESLDEKTSPAALSDQSRTEATPMEEDVEQFKSEKGEVIIYLSYLYFQLITLSINNYLSSSFTLLLLQNRSLN